MLLDRGARDDPIVPKQDFEAVLPRPRWPRLLPPTRSRADGVRPASRATYGPAARERDGRLLTRSDLVASAGAADATLGGNGSRVYAIMTRLAVVYGPSAAPERMTDDTSTSARLSAASSSRTRRD